MINAGNSARRTSLLIGTLLTVAVGFGLAVSGPLVRAAGPPPSMAFGPNQKAPSGNGTNEPQITVDQSGKSYLTWQGDSGFPGTRVTTTTDGSAFTTPIYPDAANNAPTALGGDVVLATTNWPGYVNTPTPPANGTNGVYWSDLATAPAGSTCAGDPQVRSATSLNQASTWTNQNNAGCQPSQVDRQWLDSYTPPSFRGTTNANGNTSLFQTYHDLGSSAIWLVRSFDGGASWQQTPFPVAAPNQALSACNTIPGGLATDKNSTHKGRVFVTWETSDAPVSAATGCNISQAQPFDHLYLAYSDDAHTCTGVSSPNGCAAPTFSQATVFDDPCVPPGSGTNPPAPTQCQDISEFFAPVAVDDAGTPYVAYVRYNLSDINPEYDVYVAKGTFDGSGGALQFTQANTHKANPGGSGTHYQPALVAGSAGAIDVGYYGTSYVEHPATQNKPAAAPNTALWYVYLSQSSDGGATFTQNQVSNQSHYYGDVCNTGIFCGNGSQFGWGDDRILFEDFGLAVGPDGGARLDWTDSRNSGCTPGSATSCQSGKTNIYFACQTSGLGLHGETVTACGQSTPLPVGVP